MAKNCINLNRIFAVYLHTFFIHVFILVHCKSPAQMIPMAAIAFFLVPSGFPSVHLCVHLLYHRLPEANACIYKPVGNLFTQKHHHIS